MKMNNENFAITLNDLTDFAQRRLFAAAGAESVSDISFDVFTMPIAYADLSEIAAGYVFEKNAE